MLARRARLEAEALAKRVNGLPAQSVPRPQTEQRANAVLTGSLPRTGSNSNDWWYGKLNKKTNNTHRIVFMNIGGLPSKKWYTKTRLLADWMEKWEADPTLSVPESLLTLPTPYSV